MAITFCQIIDARFKPGTKEALCASLIERLSAIAAALGQLPGVLFGHEPPRFMSWPDGQLQWRADCWTIKPRGISWDQVFTVVNNIKAVPYDKCTDKLAKAMIEVNAANSGNRIVDTVKTAKSIGPAPSQSDETEMKKEGRSHVLDEWTRVCLAPTAKPFELKPSASTFRGMNDLDKAKQYASRVLKFFQGHGLEVPVFVVGGPTSTTRCKFEVVSETCGYSVLHRIGRRSSLGQNQQITNVSS